MCLSRIGQIIYGALALISVALAVASVFTPGWTQLTSSIINSFNTGQMPVLNMGLFQYACSSPNTNQPSSMYQSATNQFGQINQPLTNGQQTQYGTNQYGQQNLYGVNGQPTQYGTTQYGMTGVQGQYGNNIQNPYTNQQYQQTSQNPYGSQYPQTSQYQTPYGQSSQYGTAGTYTPVWTGNPIDYCFQWWQNQPTWQKVVIVAMVIGIFAGAASFLWNLTTFCVCCFKGTIQKPLPALSAISAIALVVGVAMYWYNNQQMIQNIQLNQVPNMVIGNNTPTTSNVNYSFWMACGSAIAAIANVVVGIMIVCLSDTCL